MYLLVITGIPFTLSVVADVGSIAATLVSKVRGLFIFFQFGKYLFVYLSRSGRHTGPQ